MSDNVTPIDTLDSDVPVYVEPNVSAAQVTRGLREAGLAVRWDDARRTFIVSQARGSEVH